MRVRAARWTVLGALVVLLLAMPARNPAPSFAEDLSTITVTNAGDSIIEGESVCPSETLCTLRRAIQLAHADEAAPGGAVTIVFDPVIFAPDSPVTIEVLGEPLPQLNRPNTHIRGDGAGVTIDGSLLTTENQPGLRFAGESQSVRGLTIEHFTGTCVESLGGNFVAGGDPEMGHGLTVGDCTTGMVLRGADAHVHGGQIGVGEGLTMQTGIVVTGSGATIGVESDEHPWPVVIERATVAIQVGGGESSTDATLIAGNRFGEEAIDVPAVGTLAANGTAVHIVSPSTASIMRNNTFARVTGAAVAIEDPAEGQASESHRIEGNVYGAVGMAIDLRADGERQPNDPGDADTGANTLLNWPLISRATVSSVQGSAPGCASCTVAIYASTHAPGGATDRPTVPLATTLTDSNGAYSISLPGIEPETWIVASVIDGAGNTSEFGESERVGDGLVQCGATELSDGWNHAGFFGANGTPLGQSFPASGPDAGKVKAIYKLVDGTDSFLSWFANAPLENSLKTLEPGEAYFFRVEGGVSLPGGFSLNVAYPVNLKAGWNDFVYIGASGHYLDALADVVGAVSNVFHFRGAENGGTWEQTGQPGVPEWVRDFTTIVSCETYEVFSTANVTLDPMQP